jgi:tetratricopeptide (TPR) repeat protein
VSVFASLLVPLLAPVLMGAVDVDARLADAHKLAARQETSAAIDAYRALLDDGVDGAGVRYNLGSLLLESGDLGGAVQQLLAARRFAPLDDDIAHNLAVALEARADRLAGVGTTDPVWFIGERTPPLAARLALGVPLGLLGVVLALRARWRRRALAVAASVLAFTALLGAGVWLCRLDFERTQEAVVLLEQTAARKEPDAAAAESFVAHAGLSGVVVDDQGAWVRLRMDNGLEAWLERSALGFVGDDGGRTGD